MGNDVEFVSTRAGSEALMRETHYLAPLRASDLPRIALELWRAGPSGWLRGLAAWLAADLRGRERLHWRSWLSSASSSLRWPGRVASGTSPC